jgi:putative hydrolase of the HAD superfamily
MTDSANDCGQASVRIPCQAVFVDAGGVIVLPHRGLVAGALARVGVEIDAAIVPGAHYRAVRRLDSDPECSRRADAYLRALSAALGVPARRQAAAVRALAQLADRERSDQILWSEPTPDATRTLVALERAAIRVLVVTNSDGHAAQNLGDAGICQATPGAGATVTAVIDSALVGSTKPDIGIFTAALRHAAVTPASVVHVGDSLRSDIAGAHAAGIPAIHFDPDRACRSAEHRHIRSLNGIWRHVGPPSMRVDGRG